LDLIKENYHIKEDFQSKFKKMRLAKLVDREKKFRTFMAINHEVLSELYGITEIYEEEYYRFHEHNLRLRPDFIDFVSIVKDRFRLIMVTDADNIYTERTLTALNIAKYFDAIVTAEKVGTPKPYPRIFNTALKEAHNPKRVLFIGDSERRDIEGAKRMNFYTLKMDDNSDPTIADGIVHNFKEVSRIIESNNLP
jgi:HAD superfamily hydrolase (TIGR01549 family)